MSGHQEYKCRTCGYEWESLDASDCPRCRELAASNGSEMLHVDDWVRDMGFDDKPKDGDVMYARWLMLHWRLPAYMKNHFARFIAGKKLFCTYELLRYRCIGGSRMGDVWLTTNFDAELGYELRVDVAKCSAWSDSPNEKADSPTEKP